MALELGEIEKFLHEKIPITRAMGVRVANYDGHTLVLEAPLTLNHNHLGTAFGGSLSAVATLAGYALLWLELRERECHVVVRESTLSFRKPVRGDIRAKCTRPDDETIAKFQDDLSRKGKAAMQLRVTIEDTGMVAVEFSGKFVAVA